MKENLFIGQTKYTYKGQKNNPTRQKPVRVVLTSQDSSNSDGFQKKKPINFWLAL